MVKILVATTEQQGERPDDYAWAVDGELVYVPDLACDRPECGCGRGFAGMASSKATTTALVVDRPDISLDDLRSALADSLERDGWLGGDDPALDAAVLKDLLDRLLASSHHFAVGSIIERDGDLIRCRARTEPLDIPAAGPASDTS